MNVWVKVTKQDLIDGICDDFDIDEVFDFICELDDKVCDFDFTEKLINNRGKILLIDDPTWKPNFEGEKK